MITSYVVSSMEEISSYGWPLVVLFCAGLVSLIYTLRQKWSCLPPGPMGLPVLGYLPFIGKEPYKTFTQLAEKYGPIFSVYLGNRFAVVLNNFDVIKEALVKQGNVFAGRPRNNLFTMKGQEEVLAATDGPIWKAHRQFAFTALKDLGFGKTTIEPLIKDEISHFLDELDKHRGRSYDPSELLRYSIANNVCAMIFGKRFDYDDPMFLKMNYLVDQRLMRFSNVSSRIFFPWLKKLPLMAKWTDHSKLIELQNQLLEVFRELVKQHKEQNVIENCYIDSYLKEQQRRKEQNCDEKLFDDEKLEGNILVLLAAGSDTLGLTMAWALKYLMLYPEVQDRVQAEIDKVIGGERLPCWDDKGQLPYTWATMMEIMRITSILPLNVAHSNVSETILQSYKIPERSYIISNLWSVHHDPKLWGDPENFRPDRFIDKDGGIANFPYFIPFSVGPRTCLGESMARMEYFLYFTMLFQRFRVGQPENVQIDLNCCPGFTLRPTKFECYFRPRDL